MASTIDSLIFTKKNHDISTFEDVRAYERACRRGEPSILLVQPNQIMREHAQLSERLRLRPFKKHNETAYPGNRYVCAAPGSPLPSLAGRLNEYQPFHADGSHMSDWLADFLISYFQADSTCGGELNLTSLDDLLDTLSGQEIHLLLNMTVEIERDLGVRASRYEGPLLTMRDRNTFAFRWRYDSVSKARCIDLDPCKQRDGEELLKYIAAQLDAIPRTIVKPQPGLMVYVTQFGLPNRCLLHGRSAASAPQQRIAKRDWLNVLY